ncbi:autotransporter outer membrane beta-barrel domain-containing protein [Escherichia coli]|nr:autotransporter outer membrane beta-barrel domain-containing protein [Escherichia coli]
MTASVEGGYTFEAGTFRGSEGTLNTWYVQPQAQITWMGVKDSDHNRKDGTRIETEGDGNGASAPFLNPPFYPRSRISQRLSRRADKTCFQIDLSSLKDKTDNILLCG